MSLNLHQPNISEYLARTISLPEKEAPVSISEKLAREDIKKLTKNSEETRKLKEQIRESNNKHIKK